MVLAIFNIKKYKNLLNLEISEFSNLNAPKMDTADQTKIEKLSLVQGTVLAVLLCGVVALFWGGQAAFWR